MTEKLRIGFMGTPDFASEALDALIRDAKHENAGYEIVCVYSQPPRPSGRGNHEKQSPVHILAEEHGIEVRTPKSLKTLEVQEEFQALNLDIAVVAAYGLILPIEILEAPKHGCVNIHASLLPRWRGASPIQRAIIAGDKQSGVTIMQMDEGLDTGPEIMKCPIELALRETAESLHDQLALLGGEMIVETLRNLAKNGELLHINQNPEGMTYAKLLRKQDGRINWNDDADTIDRQMRALNPWPGTWTKMGEQRFKIIDAIPVASASQERGLGGIKPGTLTDKFGHVQCGDNSQLRIKLIQPDGKKPMSMGDAIRGKYLEDGCTFE